MEKIIIQNKQEIINFYLKHLNVNKCSKEFNYGYSVITKLLQENKVLVRKKKLVNEVELINFYKQGNSQINCIKQFKCSSTTVKKILDKYNTKIRNKSEANRIYFCKDNYFEKIDSKDKAYFLGLLISDGWNKNNGFGISLLEKDKYILDSFKKHIEYSGNLLFYYSGENKQGIKNKMYSLIITSKKLSQDLSKLGCIPNKSHHTYFPNIPEEFYSHFIRGVFDGDGCVSKSGKNLVFNILGNLPLITKIQEILIKNCCLSKTKLKIHNKLNKSIVYLVYGGNIQTQKIAFYLYKNCDDLYLKRKKEKFYEKL